MSLNELILNQPKPWLPIRVWNCVIDNVFQLIPNAVAGRVLRAINNAGVGTWQDPGTFSVTSIASNASVSVNGVASAPATTGDVTVAATGVFGTVNVTTTSGNVTTTSGNVTTTSGNFVTSSGNITASAGNLTVVGSATLGTTGAVQLTAGAVGSSCLSSAVPTILGLNVNNLGIGAASIPFMYTAVITNDNHSANELIDLTAQQVCQGMLFTWQPGTNGALVRLRMPSAATIITYLASSMTVRASLAWFMFINNPQNTSTATALTLLQSADASTHFVNSGTSTITQQLVRGTDGAGAPGTSMRMFVLVINNVGTPEVLIYF